MMIYFFLNCLAFTIALGVLITVHECGHFLLARFFGVIVERFSIGFGYTLLRWYDKRGTEYIIAVIPLGGYVKMLDKCVVDTVVNPECCCGSFHHKSIWQRVSIISAGPVFNILFAIFAYFLVFLIGVPSYCPIIGDVYSHSIAARAGITPGMEIKSIDGIVTSDWNAVYLQLINKIENEKMIFNIVSSDTMQNEQKILDLRNWIFKKNKKNAIMTLGIIPLYLYIEPVIADVQKGSAAMKAGFQVNDKIIKVNGWPVDTWKRFIDRIYENTHHSLRISIDRYGNIIDIVLHPDMKLMNGGIIKNFSGIVPKMIPLPEKYKMIQPYNVFLALSQAISKTWQLICITVSTLEKLVIGSITLDNLSGPISIAQHAKKSAEYGFIYYLMFLALISINLGMINLFPLPMLDGGHLLFLAIEKLKGEPVSAQVRDFSDRIGSILVILITSLALLNDFSRLFFSLS